MYLKTANSSGQHVCINTGRGKEKSQEKVSDQDIGNLTVGAFSFILGRNLGLFLVDGFLAGRFQIAAGFVGDAVGAAHLVVALADANAKLAFLIVRVFYALHSGAAPPGSLPTSPAELAQTGSADLAAAAGVKHSAQSAAIGRERGAGAGIACTAAPRNTPGCRCGERQRSHENNERKHCVDVRWALLSRQLRAHELSFFCPPPLLLKLWS